jgi:hypothetical protein
LIHLAQVSEGGLLELLVDSPLTVRLGHQVRPWILVVVDLPGRGARGRVVWATMTMASAIALILVLSTPP